ncbi:MAG TPA: asparagine synthase (glutamine-hydrolyzing) [Bryobacteraceae bacterium]|nr:asparagine synthase (glutamine-hydrolyzing) [Bryobacteraceae bacterium]
MCGIAGFISAKRNSEARSIIGRMADAIAHRGPDDSGYYVDEFAALGHRRLSIIDVPGGHQPMANEAGSLQIVYNGEIFNHVQLREQLERAGHQYRTHCDTETIVHAFEEFGPECLAHFRGMFAFAIWDGATNRLFCARDRLGKKPLYYFWDGSLFAFASEIKALLRHPSISARVEEEALQEHMAFGYLSGENTLFRGIKKLLPGHYLSVDFAMPQPQLRIEQYWDVPQATPSSGTARELITETRRRLEDTVQSRLMSDVPLGVFLSGGVDSSAIAAIAAKFTRDPVQSFSVGYNESRYSELRYADEAAAAIGARHREVLLGREQFFSALPELIWHEDEPIAWPSSIPLYFVSRLASQHVKVVLTGEGSDELFGGYERYRWNLINVRGASLYSRLPSAFRRGISDFVQTSSLLGSDLRRKLRHTFLARGESIEALYLDNFYCAFAASGQGTDIYANYRNHFDKRPGDTLLSRMLYADQKTYLVELLMKQDRMSMAASIESRVPLLDHHLVEFAASIPGSLKIHRGVQKYIFKKAVEDLLPRNIVFRKKMGFPTPLRAWLREDAAEPVYELLENKSSFIASVVERKTLADLLGRHRSNQEDATDRIWRLLNLEIWAGLFITGTRKREPVEPPEAIPAAERAN